MRGTSSYHTHVLGSTSFRPCEAAIPWTSFHSSRAWMWPCPNSKVWFPVILLSYNQMSKMPKFGGPCCLSLQPSRRLQWHFCTAGNSPGPSAAQQNNLSKAGSLPLIFCQTQDLLAEDLLYACSLGDKEGASKTGESPQVWRPAPSRCFPRASLWHCVLQ